MVLQMVMVLELQTMFYFDTKNFIKKFLENFYNIKIFLFKYNKLNIIQTFLSSLNFEVN